MGDHMKLTVDVPPHPSVVVAWAGRAAEAANRALAFERFTNYFFNRHAFDCRNKAAVGGGRVEGSFYDGPLRGRLTFGTEDERRRGLLLLEDDDHWIQPFSMSTPLTGAGMFLIPHSPCRLEGYYLDTDPAEMAYRALTETFGITGACAAYLVDDRQGPEAVAFFFPLKHGDGDEYLLVIKNTRYGDEDYRLFEGNPEAYARLNRRRVRNLGEERLPFYKLELPENYPALTGLADCMAALVREGQVYTGNFPYTGY